MIVISLSVKVIIVTIWLLTATSTTEGVKMRSHQIPSNREQPTKPSSPEETSNCNNTFIDQWENRGQNVKGAILPLLFWPQIAYTLSNKHNSTLRWMAAYALQRLHSEAFTMGKRVCDWHCSINQLALTTVSRWAWFSVSGLVGLTTMEGDPSHKFWWYVMRIDRIRDDVDAYNWVNSPK